LRYDVEVFIILKEEIFIFNQKWKCVNMSQNLSSSLCLCKIVLYGLASWSLILNEEDRLKNEVLWSLFGPKREEVTEVWRKLLNESFIICTLLHQILLKTTKLKIGWTGCMQPRAEKRNAYKILVGKLGGKKPFGIHRPRLGDRVKVEIGYEGTRYEGTNWNHLTLLVFSVMNIQVS
jgi:hypothetical protein